MAKLNKKTRDSLKDSDFGIPSKRMYPIHDKAHVEAAVKLFGHASNEDKPELAYRILKKAKEFGMDSSGWTQVNLWAKKYKGESTNESTEEISDEKIVDSIANNESEKEDLTEGITEAAASGSASLLTVKNQLMKLVGNAFKFIGGSLVPKFTMQSTEKPAVAFDVNTDGRNVEVTPKYNGVADTLHKKKGIAFMRAAEVIADFADNVVNSFKSPTPATAMENVEYYDEYFEALLEYADELMDECELEAYLDENPDMEFAICIGEDYLYDDDDFDAYFEGTEYDGEDRDIIIESDLFTETAHPYDDYLKRHQYDPKTNTVVVNGVRIDAGKKGSKKQRNRLNKFLREHDYDPKTETIRTDIPDGQGGFKRVRFDINSSVTDSDVIKKRSFSTRQSPLTRDDPANTGQLHDLELDSPEGKAIEDAARQIAGITGDVDIRDIEYVIRHHERDNTNRPYADQIHYSMGGPDAPKYTYSQLLEMRQKYYDYMRANNPRSDFVSMRKDYMMDRPEQSNAVLGHEIGHISRGDTANDIDYASTDPDSTPSKYVDFLSRTPIGGTVGEHELAPGEYDADSYGRQFAQKHGYGKRMDGRDLYTPMMGTHFNDMLGIYETRLKSVLTRDIPDERTRLRNELVKGSISAETYTAIIDQLNKQEDELKRKLSEVPTYKKTRTLPPEIEDSIAARSAYGVMDVELQRQKQEREASYRRKLLRDQLQQQIDSGQLTPKQINQARKRIARIDQFERGVEGSPLIDPKTGRPIINRGDKQVQQGASRLAKASANMRRFADPQTNPYAIIRGDAIDSKTGEVVRKGTSKAVAQQHEDALKRIKDEQNAALDQIRRGTYNTPSSKSAQAREKRAMKYADERHSAREDIIKPYQHFLRTGEVLKPQQSIDDAAQMDEYLKNTSTEELQATLAELKAGLKEAQAEFAQNPDNQELAADIAEIKKFKRKLEKTIRERTGQAASKKTKSSSSSETPKKKRTGTKVTETEVPAEDTKKKPASKKTSGTSSADIAKTSAPKKKPEEDSAKSEPKKKEAAPEKKPVEKKPTPAKPAPAKKSETKPEETKK